MCLIFWSYFDSSDRSVMSTNLAIRTEALERIYKICGAKKGEPREMFALREVHPVLRYPSREANRRINELLEVVELGDRINTKSSDLSSGLR